MFLSYIFTNTLLEKYHKKEIFLSHRYNLISSYQYKKKKKKKKKNENGDINI